MEQYAYGVIYGTMGERLAFDRPHTEPPLRGTTLASMLNELSARGWEFVSLAAPGAQVVCLVRKGQGQAQAARPAASQPAPPSSGPPPFQV